MTVLKLYDFKSSPNCQRVKVVLAEKNLPYEIVPIDLRKQEQKTPEYLKLNPYGKVPVLIDYGFAYFDSPYQKLRMELTKDPKEQNQQVIDSAKSDLKKLLQRFENEIGDQQYLMGDFSLVDADLIPRFTRLEGFGILPDPSLPRLGKYMERMKARPSVKAIL